MFESEFFELLKRGIKGHRQASNVAHELEEALGSGFKFHELLPNLALVLNDRITSPKLRSSESVTQAKGRMVKK
jgi:hypothetical protein